MTLPPFPKDLSLSDFRAVDLGEDGAVIILDEFDFLLLPGGFDFALAAIGATRAAAGKVLAGIQAQDEQAVASA
jgi:hypothetical protein